MNKISSDRKTKQKRLMIASKCGICDKKKSRFIKNSEVRRLLSKLGIRTPLNNVPLIGGIVF